jgi:beta-N-acetylglucosaminidase
VLKKFVERFRVSDVFVEKAGVVLGAHALQQGGYSRSNVAYKPKIDGRAAANVFGILVDLDFLHAVAREELREGKISAKQQ